MKQDVAYTTAFNNFIAVGKTYESIQSCRNEVVAFGKRFNVQFVTKKSSDQYVYLACKLGISYRPHKSKKNMPKKPRARPDRKCCPCLIYVAKNKASLFEVRSLTAKHNHYVGYGEILRWKIWR